MTNTLRQDLIDTLTEEETRPGGGIWLYMSVPDAERAIDIFVKWLRNLKPTVHNRFVSTADGYWIHQNDLLALADLLEESKDG